MSFQERVAQNQEEQAEAEFNSRAEQAGYPGLIVDRSQPTPIRADPEAGAGVREANTFRRRTPVFDEEPEAPEVTRKLRRGSGRREIKFSTELVPIFMTETHSGKEYQLWARRVPATEMGYLERLENILSDVRLEMRRLRVIRDVRDQRQLDKLNAEYNRVAEEYLAFQVEMPEGFFQDLNTAGLSQLQRQLAEIMRGTDEADEGN